MWPYGARRTMPHAARLEFRSIRAFTRALRTESPEPAAENSCSQCKESCCAQQTRDSNQNFLWATLGKPLNVVLYILYVVFIYSVVLCVLGTMF